MKRSLSACTLSLTLVVVPLVGRAAAPQSSAPAPPARETTPTRAPSDAPAQPGPTTATPKPNRIAPSKPARKADHHEHHRWRTFGRTVGFVLVAPVAIVVVGAYLAFHGVSP